MPTAEQRGGAQNLSTAACGGLLSSASGRRSAAQGSAVPALTRSASSLTLHRIAASSYGAVGHTRSSLHEERWGWWWRVGGCVGGGRVRVGWWVGDTHRGGGEEGAITEGAVQGCSTFATRSAAVAAAAAATLGHAPGGDDGEGGEVIVQEEVLGVDGALQYQATQRQQLSLGRVCVPPCTRALPRAGAGKRVPGRRAPRPRQSHDPRARAPGPPHGTARRCACSCSPR